MTFYYYETFTSKKNVVCTQQRLVTPKANSMGVVGPRGVKKTWLDSTRLSLEDLCFKLSNFVFVFSFSQTKRSNSMWVSKSLIKITNPWKERRKEGRRASNWASKLFTHPKLWCRNFDQSPNLISFSFFFKLRNFPSKKFSNKLLSLFFPPPFFSFFSPLFFGWGWGGFLWCLQQIPTGLWFLFEILKRDLEMSSWNLNHLLLLALSLSLSLSLYLCSQSLLLPTAIAAFSTLFFSFSSSNSVQRRVQKRKPNKGERALCSFCSCKSRSFFF